jgi:hypothetical protein
MMTMLLMRGDPASAISAAIHPPMELPATVTSSRPSSSSRAM